MEQNSTNGQGGGFSFKRGGKQLPGQAAQANIFAMAASTSQRQDRSYYKSLYNFNADVELAEYSLPVLSNQQPLGKGAIGKHGGSSNQGKTSSGVINATQLPPLSGMRGQHPQGIEEEDMMEEMEMDQMEEMDEMEDQDSAQGVAKETAVNFEALRNIIEKVEDAGKDQVVQARVANYISKGTYIWQMLSQIETGEQAISFFAKYGHNTPIKFVNCKRKPVSPDQFRPYDLVKIDDEKALENEYFTISAQGVVQVCKDQSRRGSKLDPEPTEYLSLSEWMQQSTMFNVLTSMKFFKHYIIGKVFSLWKGNVRFKMFNKTRQDLAGRLIQMRPAFSISYMDINKTLYEMQTLKTFQIPKGGKVWDTKDFTSDQKTARDSAKAHYNEKVDEIQNGRLSGLVAQVAASRTLKEEEDLEHGKMGQAAKHKSMVLQRQEDELKNRVLSLARRNYEDLGTFIRLIDYMVVETQVKINQESADLILAAMKEQGKFFIKTLVNFAPDGMRFEPAKNDFITQFENILMDMQGVTEEVGRVINHQDFTQFLHRRNGRSGEGPRFKAIVENSEAYATTKRSIQSQISKDFEDLQTCVQAYEVCREIDDFSATFNFEEWKSKEGNSSLDKIKEMLALLAKWEGNISKIKPQEARGLMQVQGRLLSQRLGARVKEEQGRMKDHLYKLADSIVKEVTRAFDAIKTSLNKPTNTLQSYVDYVNRLEECKVEKEDLADRKKKLEEMKQLLSKYRAKDEGYPNVAQTSFQTWIERLTTDITEVESLIAKADQDVLESKESNVADLEKRITEEQEKVQSRIEEITTKVVLNTAGDSKDAAATSAGALEEAGRIKKKFDESVKRLQTFKSYQETMKVATTTIPEIDEFEKKFSLKNRVWSIRQAHAADSKRWYHEHFLDQEAAVIIQTTRERNSELIKMKDKLPKDVKDEVHEATLAEVDKVLKQCELIGYLGNKAMKVEVHWPEVWKLVEEPPVTLASFTLDDLLAARIENHIERVSEIAAQASGEADILKNIEEIRVAWETTNFTIKNYRDTKDRFYITEIEDLTTLLEDHQMRVQGCMGSRHVARIRADVEAWERKLGTVSDVIDEWLVFQKSWMYLENIFNAEDIIKQLPEESKKFSAVDKFWKDHMARAKKTPNVIDICASDDLLKKLQKYNKQLDEIQKCLEDYLGKKRAAFPRFYFLSNDELLEILSQTRNAQAVQPHLRKCFDNVVKVEFSAEKDSAEILGMWSAEREYVAFSDSVWARGAVEHWLTKIEDMMRQTLFDITRQSLLSYPKNGLERNAWFFESCAQAVLTIDQVQWTVGATQAIAEISKGKNKKALEDFREFCNNQIGSMVSLVRGDLNQLQRNAMGALIVVDVHARDVVTTLMKNRVDNLNDFDWTCQLRYYWEKVPEEEGISDVYAKQTNTRFRYGYEYLGNGPRLVITPLTDKCYMTLTGALHLNFGGSPQGPAGTGKTETTKDLAKALAIQCVVFNCSDGLDFKMMARFFSGLAQGGAWACFDEFNRIDIEVLSVIAQQMLTIQSAVRQKLKEFIFDEKLMPLNLKFGVFITMNPGYAGRTELPDNLKSLFRPVAMMIPDYGLIAQIILYSEGFKTADDLSRKMVQLYQLSSEQLSKQDHYDFGMRAVKSVLVMAGALRRQDNNTAENIVLIRAMRDSNVPKFLEHDLPLFDGIVNDLFPGVDVPFIDYGKLQVAIENQLRLKKLQIVPKYVKKIIQLLETMMVRHGVMLVGLTGTGKTTCCTVLGDALEALHAAGSKEPWHKPVLIETLNPKSVTMGELFGETNLFTNEWTEGLVSKLVKDAVSALEGAQPDKKRWINFDGPVDALWIENMNTVLDDNKMLCLANGQRIKMPETCTMMFEVQDLKVASPATVSRCGMVYLEPVHLGWQPLIDTWQEKMAGEIPEPFLSQIVEHIKSIMTSMLPIVRKQCKEVVQSTNSNLVQSCLNMLHAFLGKSGIDLEKNKDKMPNPQKAALTYLSFSVIWSLGANLHDDSRTRFGEVIQEAMKKRFPDFPQRDPYEFGIDPELHKFQPWDEQTPSFQFDPAQSFFEILVPTSDTVKYKYVLKTLAVAGRRNVLLTGETGVGKSVIVKDFLSTAPDFIVSACVNFSGKTTTKNLQDAFEGNLEAKRKTLLGPPGGKTMIFFIDDVNMPQLDRYGSQPPCELLRQTIDSSGFYDTKKLIFKEVKETTFVCACAPPGGGRNAVTPRLFRHFNMVWVPQLSDSSMKTVFSSILKGFLDQAQSTGLPQVVDPLISASVELYQKTISDFLPTPSKCHYTFNLRDLSKVVQGILMMDLHNIDSKPTLVSIWIHETFRVFRDRLVDQSDRDKYSKLAHEKVEGDLEMEWQLKDYESILFGDYESPERKYLKLNEINILIPRLDRCLELYNTDNSPMNLVFFGDCIQHLSRIARILRQQRGNAMLVGVGGSGRSSMARLAAHMMERRICQIEITKSYKEKEFQEDIKKLLRRAAGVSVQGEEDAGQAWMPPVFIFSDTQIVKESFLEDINNLLNSGEIPNLFPADDKAQIHEELGSRAREAKGSEGRDLTYAYFVQICRENLHIVLAFSPVGDGFRNRCRQFPSIINCCTIDWYNPWPAEALYSVAHRQYSAHETALSISEHLDALCQTSVEMHTSVSAASDSFYNELRRRNYTTPTSYLDLVKTYIEMLGIQRSKVPAQIKKYTAGLKRLAETNIMVDELKVSLIKLRPEIDKNEAETQALVVDLEVRQKAAAEQEKVTAGEEAEAQAMFTSVAAIKSECEVELNKARPIYESAVAALDSLQKGDIQEMKAYANPAAEIILVCSACCLLLGKKEDWDTAKREMADPSAFILSLKNYDKDNISEALLKKLKKYTQDPKFDPESIARKSTAAKSLCLWARAIDNYAAVMKTIRPKQAALAQAEAELKVVQEQLKGKQQALQAVRDMINKLKANYAASQKKLSDLTKEKENIEVKLGRAEKLVVGLADEAERWQRTVKVLEVDDINLVGNIILAAGYISYVGPFTAKYREKLLKNWMQFALKKAIPFSADFGVERILGEPVVIRQWCIQGLPADELSIENAIVCTQSKRWPLLIDPQSQANKWLKSMLKDNGLKVIKLSNPKFLAEVELQISMGRPTLIENIDETLDPSLEPVLQKKVVKVSGQWQLRLGDKTVNYNWDFRLFITTKLANPHYLPEVCIKVAVINFTVTPDGLEDQLLVDVVAYEQPELEQQKDQLVVQLADYKGQLADIEAKILRLVSEAGANILDEEELIITLDQSKQTSIVINEKVAEAETTAKMINENRENYRGVARRGSVLYFVIADLALIDPMYQYSLEFFSRLFNRRLEKSQKSTELEERLQILLLDITESSYLNICRGLFEKDKLLYSFLNAVQILRRSGDITLDEWNIYLRGSAVDFSSTPRNVDYISDKAFISLLGLEEAHFNFKDIAKSFADSQDAQIWKRIIASPEPAKIDFPPLYEDRLSSFQKLMVLKVIREEKLVSGIKKFVGSELGAKYIESPPYDLEGAAADSSNMTPIIFVLSPGADPILDLIALAKTKGMETRLHTLSLGQGQGKIAEDKIKHGHQSGDWVCLQNCHLSASWMPQLEKIQESLIESGIHPEYRLWLTSMPSNVFPVPVLQSGIKLTNEPPRGLKANMKRTFGDITEEDYEGCSKPKEYKKMLFALAYFHAAILERRKYGAIGWNIPYEWMTSDFDCSKRQLRMYLEEQELVPYQALNYLVSETNYGGRVTDDKDNRLIRAMLRRYFCADLMTDSYKLSKLDLYYAPAEGPLSTTRAYIETLPLDEDPEVFGLHPNANIAYERKTVGDLSETVIMIQPRIASTGAGRTPDEIAQDLCREIAAKLPPAMDRDAAHETTFTLTELGQPASLGVFLGQEVDRFNALLRVMRATLDQLDRAVQGTVVMSAPLESMAARFLLNKVPAQWEEVGYPSLKSLSSWVADLIERVEFLAKWLTDGPPVSFWLPAFFFPQGFMTAVRQTHARKTRTPIDALVFKTHVCACFADGITAEPEAGVILYGVFLEGARWDFGRSCLEDSEPGKSVIPFPCVWLEPVEVTTPLEEGCYSCPLYKTSTRRGELLTTGHSTNFVGYLHLPTEAPADYWLRRGAALLTMTDD